MALFIEKMVFQKVKQLVLPWVTVVTLSKKVSPKIT